MRLKVYFIYLCLLAVSSIAFAEPIDTSFTYQGQLEQNGEPANGIYIFSVTLVDETGTSMATTQILFDQTVADGLFGLELNFDDAIYSTEKLYLKILVGTTLFNITELLPHTPISSTPFAIQAQEATFADTADTALISLDNEFTRVGNVLSLGSTNEQLLLNPDLSGGGLINSSTFLQINTAGFGFGGMYLNGGTSSIPFYGFAYNGAPFSWIQSELTNNSMSIWFAGTAAPALTITPDQVKTDGKLVGDHVTEYATNNYHHAAPIAYGYFSDDGTRFSGTENMNGVWNPSAEHYELTIDGEPFHFASYTVSVTPQSASPRIAVSSSFSSKLLITIFDLSGDRVQNRFNVIVYKNENVDID